MSTNPPVPPAELLPATENFLAAPAGTRVTAHLGATRPQAVRP
ncbi:hypothetical protein SAMN05421837_104574 [Amycolatopsis pretoriensis]|uniref:Uncharacterized protein n=1 Tax=Amycolatopsis pretoriensis TaxID=218821 RepID=A0A1H5QVG1_9PSEU|nr:hypothetical protein SAMN05421837_104574 [Amycolatopsis pretoriensis]